VADTYIWACAYCSTGGAGDAGKVNTAAADHLRAQDYEADRHVALYGRATRSLSLGERPLNSDELS
jgi:hypothetical protein